jgi:outer membrane protein
MKNSLKRALPAAIALALGLSAMPAAAYEAGDWVVRGRIINVNPNDDSGAASLNGMPIVGSGVGVNDDTTLELDFTYMLDPHWGMELILATTKHEASGKGVLAPAGTILDTWVLPPTLTLQYHFSPSSNIRPYAGVGLNYTTAKLSDGIDTIKVDVDIDPLVWGIGIGRTF